MEAPDTPLGVFCSFAPNDADLCNQLHNHLRPLERVGTLTLWHQHLLTAGIDRAKAIDEQLASASIIILLISPAFFASDSCYSIEMQQAMQRHETGKARVIPILIRPVNWQTAPFSHLSVLPTSREPVSLWRNRDAAFAEIIADIYRVIEELTQSREQRPLVGPSSVWSVPYRRNPHFTGRDELLNRLDQQLSREVNHNATTMRRAALTQSLAIKGLGGVGKTQVAVEYAYRAYQKGCYTYILWVHAASEEALLTSFVGLAELLPAFPAKSETDRRKLVAEVKRWLEECKQGWLLIFDNADDISLVQEYLPQQGNGSILLTTRVNAVGSLAVSLEVEKMDLMEGRELLLHRAQRSENVSDQELKKAEDIVLALDGFPLALDQAGAYIEETNCRFGDYFHIYQDHRKDLLARRGKQATNYPDSVATTWSLSFQKIEMANPAAAELLRLCAFLTPDHIPEELLKDGAPHWPPLLQQAVADLFVFNQMLEELLTFSLVKRLTEDHMLSIHRLVQVVQVERMEPDEQRQWAERVVRATNEVFPRHPAEVNTWPQSSRYLEQVQACNSLIEHYALVFNEAADLLYRTSTYLHEHALYSIEEPLLLRAIAIQEQESGLNHPKVAILLTKLADLYNEQAKYEQAQPLYQRAIHIFEQAFGPNHPEVAQPLHGLANLYYLQRKDIQAQSLYQRVLKIQEQAFGPDHPRTGGPLRGLANVYQGLGEYEQAELLYQRAISVWEQAFGPDYHPLIYPLGGLAQLYQTQEKYEQAELLYQQALDICKRVLGPNHCELAHLLHGLANLYSKQGEYEHARFLYQRALRIHEQSLGRQHPRTTQVRKRLHATLVTLGRTEEAARLDIAYPASAETKDERTTNQEESQMKIVRKFCAFGT